jgi:hypothetical protein
MEYRAYREILEKAGAKYGCLNYEYLWRRMPKFDISECDFLEELMVHPGQLWGYALEDYERFLDDNAEYISFALAAKPMDCAVKVLPFNHGREYYISYEESMRPFARQKFKRASEAGDSIHGFGFDLPFFESTNNGLWMKGRAGIASDFRNGKMRTYFENSMAYTISSARRLILEGYKIDLMKIKKRDWKEIAKVNGINWMKYQEVMDEKI